MGFDKPDLGFVIHYQRPGSVHYQVDGQAGASLWDSFERRGIKQTNYFIQSAFQVLFKKF